MVRNMSVPARGGPSSTPSIVDPHQGERIGRYHVISQLSVGGMAELFLGYTAGPGGFRKYVALKRILPDVASDTSFEQMFLDEARITAAFSHPHIGQVFELGRDETGLFLAMEFIAGQDLSSISRVCPKRGQPLPMGFSLSVMRDVCLALHYAHTFTTPGGKPMPVIHRDVAQKNVMVTYDGVVKLLDFGIAKARGAASRTQVGMVKGTTGYMSPEQVRGEPLDGRSDLFAAGVMLHEMLTGQRLFSGESEIQEMRMILDAPIASPSDIVRQVPQAVSAVVLKALARDRAQRYATGRDMARAIEAAASSLLFDADQRAAVLEEPFRDKREATRRLLEKADAMEPEPEPQLASEPLGASDDKTELRTAVMERDLETRVVSRSEARRPPPPAPTPPPVARRAREPEAGEGVVTTGRRVPNRPPPAVSARAPDEPSTQPSSAVSSPPAAPARSSRWGLILLLLVVGVGLALGAMRLLGSPRLPEFPAPPPPSSGADLSGGPKPIEPPASAQNTPEPGVPVPASSVATGQSGATSGVTKEPARDKEPTKEPGTERPRTGKSQGKLTLVVLPEAEVFLNGRSLGKTPLFNVSMPVGQHRLRIKGEDGKQHELSVPIEAGKTAQFKLKLQDIPEG